MRIVSLRVGEPEALPYRGNAVLSSIAARRETREAVQLGFDGFDGDRVGDPELHGGPDKAACCFPTEHLARLAEWMRVDELPQGAVGENLSLEGLLETDAHVGDVFRLGGATVQVAQPRGPCFKLAARWGIKNLPAKLSADCASGFYFRVLEPGAVRAGDKLELLERGGPTTVAEVMRVTYVDRHDLPAIRAVIEEPALAEQWKAALRQIASRRLALGT
jgi:MOSC domain-containing protein YiiM